MFLYTTLITTIFRHLLLYLDNTTILSSNKLAIHYSIPYMWYIWRWFLIWRFGEFVFICQIKCTHCLHSSISIHDLDSPCHQTKYLPIYITYQFTKLNVCQMCRVYFLLSKIMKKWDTIFIGYFLCYFNIIHTSCVGHLLYKLKYIMNNTVWCSYFIIVCRIVLSLCIKRCWTVGILITDCGQSLMRLAKS